ncbi:hypothetical protein BDQ17DRAFT_1366815 [Cyathus striatus]|nr:hypothetical protein BDQ17DRAFT_1366815 [Cyathus striatus]
MRCSLDDKEIRSRRQLLHSAHSRHPHLYKFPSLLLQHSFYYCIAGNYPPLNN